MISVIEPPEEFVPRGRAVVEEHVKINWQLKQMNVPAEKLLLQRLQNVHIKDSPEYPEFWSIRELHKYCGKQKIPKKRKQASNTTSQNKDLDDSTDSDEEYEQEGPLDTPNLTMYSYLINSEEELYVKGQTAVWTKGKVVQFSLGSFF